MSIVAPPGQAKSAKATKSSSTQNRWTGNKNPPKTKKPVSSTTGKKRVTKILKNGRVVVTYQ